MWITIIYKIHLSIIQRQINYEYYFFTNNYKYWIIYKYNCIKRFKRMTEKKKAPAKGNADEDEST